jgi:DNA-binding transcriptional regulator YiaG
MENNEPLTPQPEAIRAEGDRRFAACLKRIRTALQSKQVWLSGAIGCSDAAVSLWESGARVPSPQSLGRLLAALAEEGTPTSELLELRRMWVADYAGRRAARRMLR